MTIDIEDDLVVATTLVDGERVDIAELPTATSREVGGYFFTPDQDSVNLVVVGPVDADSVVLQPSDGSDGPTASEPECTLEDVPVYVLDLSEVSPTDHRLETHDSAGGPVSVADLTASAVTHGGSGTLRLVA